MASLRRGLYDRSNGFVSCCFCVCLITLLLLCVALCLSPEQALREAVASETITKEGLKLKQISLTDFKVTNLQRSRSAARDT